MPLACSDMAGSGADDAGAAAATIEHPAGIPAVSIAGRAVGDRRPTFVIAEAGVNHDGRPRAALALIDAAVAAGADAVKFQVFSAAEIATRDAGKAAYQHRAAAESQREMLARLELSDDALSQLAAHCAARHIQFLATPFSPADVARLDRLGVAAIKIASTDLNNRLLLRRAAATGKPLIVSTGAATAAEIRDEICDLRTRLAPQRLILMHCVSAYPAPVDVINLRAVAALRARFGVPCGLSDHTTDVTTGGLAVAIGACILEKHVTLDRGAPGPDHAMSLDPPRFAEYVRNVRVAEDALGNGSLGMIEVERDVRRVARRSLVASCEIAAGTVLSESHLAAKRPEGGIPPNRIDEVLGRRARRSLPAEAPLAWDDLS